MNVKTFTSEASPAVQCFDCAQVSLGTRVEIDAMHHAHHVRSSEWDDLLPSSLLHRLTVTCRLAFAWFCLEANANVRGPCLLPFQWLRVKASGKWPKYPEIDCSKYNGWIIRVIILSLLHPYFVRCAACWLAGLLSRAFTWRPTQEASGAETPTSSSSSTIPGAYCRALSSAHSSNLVLSIIVLWIPRLSSSVTTLGECSRAYFAK